MLIRAWARLLAYFSRPSRDELKEAERFVWRAWLGMKYDPPRIVWYHGSVFERDGVRYYGLFLAKKYTVLLAWQGKFSDSAYAHELLHASQWLKGHFDPEHTDADWRSIKIVNECLRNKNL